MRVTQKNPNWQKNIKKQAEKLSARVVAVGFPQGEGGSQPFYDSGASILQVAVWNNYGMGVPKRPFMDNAAPKMRAMFAKESRKAAEKIKDGEIDEETFLKAVGLKAESCIVKEINDMSDPPNAPETIKRKKGTNNPLVDTGALKQNIKSQVRNK